MTYLTPQFFKLKSYLCIICGILSVALLQAQSARLVATPDATQVEVGYTLGITFSLEQAEGRSFTLPPMTGFKVVAGPNESYSTTIMNGKVTQRQAWSFMLIALEPGSFEIGAASVITKDGVLKSAPIQIKVKGAGATTGSAKTLASKGEKVFVQTKLSTDTAFIGQNVRLDHILHTRIPVESFQLLSEVEYPQFYARDLRRIDAANSEKTFGKYTFATRILRAVSLIPQERGVQQIAPSSYQLGILADPGSAAPRDPFGRLLGRTFKPLTLATTAASLTILPLPDGAPASFCGLVGNYELKVEVDKKNLTTDDAFLVTLQITGDGDPRMLNMPTLNFGNDLEVYPPKLVSDESWESDNQGYFHTSVLEYYVVPKSTGDFKLTPEITVFDPEAQVYQKLPVESTTVSITKGSGIKRAPLAGKDNEEQPYWPYLLGAFVLSIAGLGLYFFAKNRKKQEPAFVPVQKPTPQVKIEETVIAPSSIKEEIKPTEIPTVVEAVRTKLAEPNTHATPQVFYRELEQFICMALGDDSLYQTREKLSKMQPNDAANTLLHLLETCERVRYAGAQPNAANFDQLDLAQEAIHLLGARIK